VRAVRNECSMMMAGGHVPAAKENKKSVKNAGGAGSAQHVSARRGTRARRVIGPSRRVVGTRGSTRMLGMGVVQGFKAAAAWFAKAGGAGHAEAQFSLRRRRGGRSGDARAVEAERL
jgi:hypothetical protein